MRYTQKVDETKFYRDAKKSNACWCEQYKRPGFALCYRCWKRLPRDMQREFFGTRIGAGFEEAYDAAVAWLSE